VYEYNQIIRFETGLAAEFPYECVYHNAHFIMLNKQTGHWLSSDELMSSSDWLQKCQEKNHVCEQYNQSPCLRAISHCTRHGTFRIKWREWIPRR